MRAAQVQSAVANVPGGGAFDNNLEYRGNEPLAAKRDDGRFEADPPRRSPETTLALGAAA